MHRASSYGFIVLALGAILAACQNDGVPQLPVAAAGDVQVRILTFNIEWGGTHVSFDKVVEAIRRSEADIVGIQEAEGNIERLADALAWFVDHRNYVISRFPLFDPPGADGKYVFAEISPGRVVAIANLHLPSDPYGPDLVRDGAPLQEVLANERAVRMPALQTYLDASAKLKDSSIPIFVTGDFNSPTHTDWMQTMVGKRAFLDYAVAWPVSIAMRDAGFQDAWRALFPDVETRPGLTWWAGRPPLAAYAPGENDPRDRIDLIWYAGAVSTLSAELVGEDGGPEVTINISPWPSDHRGVVATFAVDPAPMPDLITSDRRVYREGDEGRISYRFTGETSLDIDVRDANTDQVLVTRHLDSANGAFAFRSPSAGRYRIETTVRDKQYRRQFWVLKRDAAPFIAMTQNRFEAGEPVTVRWRDGPGNRNDYIAIYTEQAKHDVESMLAYVYIDALPEGTLDLSTQSRAPGRYVVRLMKDDGYEVLAESQMFEIQ